MELTTYLHKYQTNHSEGLRTLATGLLQVYKECHKLLTYLVIQCKSEEVHYKAREKWMMVDLPPTAATFFQMGFEEAIKKFAAQGYPPPREDMGFINCVAALSEFLLDAFTL